MKRLLPLFLIVLLLCACAPRQGGASEIAASTRPVAQFAEALLEGTDLTVTLLVSEPVSCLHDYTLSVGQAEQAEKAKLILLSGAGLETFLADLIRGKDTVDCAGEIELLTGDEGPDPHYWLDPALAKVMAQNLAAGLTERYPQHGETIAANLAALEARLDDLAAYGAAKTADLSHRDLITFHDGFAYFARSLDLNVLAAMEEEAGSEPAAKDLMQIVSLVREYDVPCVFAEENGSDAAAKVVAGETGVKIRTLSTALGTDDYFTAMTKNYDAIGEALS